MIAKPIALSQIKRKIGQPSYSLPQFKADMHTLWDNARTYNQEDSWVYNAAEDMQEHFDRMWEEEVGTSAASAPAPTGPSGPAQSAAPPPQPSHGFGGPGGPHVGGTGDTSMAPSGTSTPMFKANAAKIPTKIKIKLGGGGSGAGGASRRKEVMPDPTPNQSESESEEDEDDDY